jgi:phenylalanyl-tRNA synthetase beta chain
MHISLNWLQELVNFTQSPQEVADALTMAGFEVEGIEDRRTWADGVVVGKILNADRHPQADRLQVCTVDIGQPETLNIVCGAANARTGLYVPIATIGTYLPKVDLKLRPTNLRGVRSEGMICSLAELGLAKESSGIHEFEEGLSLGSDVRPLLGLDDVILDVSSTANRADALSMVGMARELAALIGEQVNLPIAKSDLSKISAADWVVVNEAKACPAYIGTLIRGVKIAPSPQWLQRRVQAAGMRPINNIVDITNYILLEWGQPLHGFDADTLGSDLTSDLAIGVRFAREQETLITLDGQTRNLTTQNLLITAGDQPVAIAGVMGGKETEVSDRTVNLVLEAALFDQTVVRRSARAQGLRTEASARYERGVNHAALEIATARALELILEIAGGEIINQSVSDRRPTGTRIITLRLERVQEILGSIESLGETEEVDSQDISAEIVTSVLTALSFELKSTAKDTWQVTVPSYRYADIEREIDLIEEIARIYGYDKFQETLPPRTELGYLGEDEFLKRKIRECFRGVGLTELTHSSLCSPTRSDQVKITNPVALEYSALRIDILSGLIEAFAYNLNQGNGCLWGFEIGRVFGQDEEGGFETDHIGGIFGGDPTVGTWQHNTQPLDWYAAKGVLETVFQRLGLTVEYQPDQQNLRLHPGRTASLWISGERLGTFGQLHPQVSQANDLPQEVYAFELDLDVLLDAIDRKSITIFQAFSTYPPSDRDIAFFVPLKVSVAEIQRAITYTGGSLLESVKLFDQYLGDSVPEGLRSLAFRLIYRASDRTLTDVDINPVHQKVRDVLEEKFRAILRS